MTNQRAKAETKSRHQRKSEPKQAIAASLNQRTDIYQSYFYAEADNHKIFMNYKKNE